MTHQYSVNYLKTLFLSTFSARFHSKPVAAMLSCWKTVFLNTLIYISALLQVSSQSNSISFTDDKPGDDKQVQLGTDVSLSWGFSYNDQAKITNGPWNAPDVQEITFGTWKYINNELFLDKKIVTVDSNGAFKNRSGYDGSKMDWSWSVSKLTFTLKDFKDQEIYGINIELGLSQTALKDFVNVKVAGLVKYVGQGENTTVRNVTAYLSETADLFFKRSAYDQMDEFLKYRIYKRNVSKEIITLGKPEDGNEFCGNVSALFICCQERYSLRYVNKTHVSFQMSNVKPKDCGLYFRQAYFRGVERDPEYETINFTAKERPSTPPGSSTQVYKTSAPKAKGGHSDIELSVTLLSTLMIFQALFK